MSEEIKKIGLLQLYFTFNGRLNRKDFGIYFVIPVIVLSLALIIWVFSSGSIKSENDIYNSHWILAIVLISGYLSIMAMGKRARDFNAPIWSSLLPYTFLGLFYCSPIIFPFMQNAVDHFANSSSKLGTAILVGFWIPHSVYEKNLYGVPCKVKVFK